MVGNLTRRPFAAGRPVELRFADSQESVHNGTVSLFVALDERRTFYGVHLTCIEGRLAA
jgi:hypothetical protein